MIDTWKFQRMFAVVAAMMVSSLVSLAADATSGPASESLPDVVEFNRDIRPLLSENCFFCHGPDKNKREAELRLDTEVGLLGDGKNSTKPGTVVPGNPSESELFRRISTTNSELLMPPRDSGKQLKPAEVTLLKRWIEQGARYEGHWSFLSIKRPEIPQLTAKVPQHPEQLAAANAIDAFVRQTRMAAKIDSRPRPIGLP